jgi:ribonucleoside-diphosphate reductase beta chain
MDSDLLLKYQCEEEMLTEEKNRFVMLPLNPKYKDIWDLYKVHENAFWKAEEIDYTADLKDWNNLTDDERFFIEHILAFFAGSDGIVIENLVTNFTKEVKISEVRSFYIFQAMIENVHGLTYSMLIETFVKDKTKKARLFNAIEEIPVVKRKADWALSWISNDQPFVIRLIAFAIIEGVFFSGAFCSIFWLKDKNKMVKALGHSNELISRDEGLHTQAAVLLYHHMKNKPKQEIVFNLMKDAVNLEKEFICEAIPCDMIGMNTKLMSEYIEFVADRLLQQLNFDKLYNTKNPFEFMEKIGLNSKTNFFESRNSDYQLGGHSGVLEEAFEFNEDDEF